MPLTALQLSIARLLAPNRSPDSHLAGGSALHFAPNSKRYSNDLDYFHDSVERVAEAFQQDRKSLETEDYQIAIELQQPGYVRAVVSRGGESTKIEWAHDSAWRFLPPVALPITGYQLHPIDVAVNKTLALAGRDEARDFLDILFVDQRILPLGALCWAAVGKDPGFNPLSLLELLRRRGKYRAEDFERLQLSEPVDLVRQKSQWLEALDRADAFIRSRPASEAGCLYYSPGEKRFIAPSENDTEFVVHHGRPGGVLPQFFRGDALAEQLEELGEVE